MNPRLLSREASAKYLGVGLTKGAKLTEAEVEAFLAALPEWSTRTVRGHRFRVRAFFELMYLTSLRPETLRGIRCPEDYRRGSRELRIRDEIDKARYGRTIDLDARAAALLDEIAPDVGPIFGRHDLRDYAKRAAEKALPPEKAADFVPYDLRHAFARHKLAKAPNLIVANGGSAPETAPESGSRRASAGSGDDETSGNTGQTGTDDEPSRVQVPVGLLPCPFDSGPSHSADTDAAPVLPPNEGAGDGDEPPPVAVTRAAFALALLRAQEDALDLFVAEAAGIDVPRAAGGAS